MGAARVVAVIAAGALAVVPAAATKEGAGARARLTAPLARHRKLRLRRPRRADDFRGGAWFALTGKGALDCARPPATFAVLSRGGPSR